ncbi:MAG TPA: DUF1697 domain-containing protein [Mycobacteriales bacterium]|nr:DUF1697 domain-containing protein [Mycobacteriales bacterium]
MAKLQRCAVLVRGVNVGGHNRLPMQEFAAVLGQLGCVDVRTYLQSGNAVVTADPTELSERVEQALVAAFDLTVRVLVRTAAELAAVVAGNPFPKRVKEPKRLHVAFLSAVPSRQLLNGLRPERYAPDELGVGAQELYLSYDGGSQQSKLTGATLEKALAPIAVTARNWTTVLALRDLTAAGQPPNA